MNVENFNHIQIRLNIINKRNYPINIVFNQPDLPISCFCLVASLVSNGKAQCILASIAHISLFVLDTSDERTDDQTLDQPPAIGNPSSRPSSRYVGNLSVDIKLNKEVTH